MGEDEALYHFSEESDIEYFVPRIHPSHPNLPAMVWTIDTEHAPMYFFPRDCPRVCYWATPNTSVEDRRYFLAHTNARMIIAVENRWLEEIQKTPLYAYQFPNHSFTCFDQGAGYYTSEQKVIPLKVEPVGDLLQAISRADVELRITPSLFPLRDALIQTTLHFSMIRMRNAL